MTARHSAPHFIEDREFHLILAGSFVFYLLLIFFFYTAPFDFNRSLSKPAPAGRKITMLLPPPQPLSKPLPPPPVPKPEKKKAEREQKRVPVPIVPEKAGKTAPPPPVVLPPQPSPEEIERKNEEARALQKAKEVEKNREVATHKFASLFGNATEDVLQDKGLNVIASSKPSANPVARGTPGGNSTDDLRVPIKDQEADKILKGLTSGKNKKTTPLLGEHETKQFASYDGPQKSGSVRTPEEFEKSFKAYEGRLKAFYDKTIQSKTSLKGILVVKITIAADGTVSRCEILSSSLNDKTFEIEIARMIQEQFRFSKIGQGDESHDRALNFHPEK